MTNLEKVIQENGGKKLLLEISELATADKIKEGHYSMFIDEKWQDKWCTDKPVDRIRVEINYNRLMEDDDRIGEVRVIIDEDGNIEYESGVTLKVNNMVKIYEILLPIFSKKSKRNKLIEELTQ